MPVTLWWTLQLIVLALLKSYKRASSGIFMRKKFLVEAILSEASLSVSKSLCALLFHADQLIFFVLSMEITHFLINNWFSMTFYGQRK